MTHDGVKRFSSNLGDLMLPDCSILKLLVRDAWVQKQGTSADGQTHYMQHHVVAQTRSTVDADQDAILQGGTEANGQPVRPGARPLVGWPVERD